MRFSLCLLSAATLAATACVDTPLPNTKDTAVHRIDQGGGGNKGDNGWSIPDGSGKGEQSVHDTFRQDGPGQRTDTLRDGPVQGVDSCIPKCAGQKCGAPDGCGGSCAQGTCSAGLRCQNGRCICDAVSCDKGCCRNDLCFPGTADTHCGGAGGGCTDCEATGKSCGADQKCKSCTPDCGGKACGAPNTCGGICSTGSCAQAGQICSGGKCVCNAASCPGGCCAGDQCLGGTLLTACGKGGGYCSDCKALSRVCKDQACCQPSCSPTATCGADDGCGGICQTGKCQAGQSCVAGKCKCDTRCTGCCQGGPDGICVLGTSSTACGRSGGTCSNCSDLGSPYSCFEQGCQKCGIWRKTLLNTSLHDAVVDSDGTIYAAGTHNNSQFHLIKYDYCGNRLAFKNFSKGSWTKMRGHGIALEKAPNSSTPASYLWLFGSASIATNNVDGVWSRHRASDLGQLTTNPLTGGSGVDEVWTGVYSGGHIFMSGTADVGGAAQRYWMIKGRTTPLAACGTTPLSGLANGGVPALGRRVRAFGSSLYYTGSVHEAGKPRGIVWRMPNTGCVPANCAGNTSCNATWNKQFTIGDRYTEFRDVYRSGGYLYAVGFYFINDTDAAALIVRINEATGETTHKTWNPTPLIDGFHAIAVYGSTIYVVGAEDWQNAGNGTRGAIASYDLSLNQRWSRFPGDRAYRDIDIIKRPKVGLIIIGDNAGYGVVRRCELDGSC